MESCSKVCSNFTLAHASSALLIYGRRRTSITEAPVTSWRASWRDSFHDTSVERALPALLADYLSALFVADSSTFQSPSSGRGNTDMHMVGQFLGFLAPSTSSLLDDSHSTGCLLQLMNRSFALFVANQRSDFHCRRDVHRRHLHPGALRGGILSATSTASSFRFRPSPTTSLRFNFEF